MIKEEAIYSFCKANNIPYFGSHLYATQGDSRRHIYMQALVESQGTRRSSEPLRILEIGSWAGGSAITWAGSVKAYNRGNGVVICVDPWRPYFDPAKIGGGESSSPIYKTMSDAAASGEIYDLFLHNIKAAGVEDVVMPFRGSSDRILPFLADRSFDIVFVDGAHTYEAVSKDLRSCARLVADGGVLCGDDLEMQLSMVDEQCNRQNLHRDFIEDPKTKNWYHPGVCRAVCEYFAKPISSWEGFWAMRKTSEGWDSTELQNAEKFTVPNHLAGSTAQVTLLMINFAREKGLIN